MAFGGPSLFQDNNTVCTCVATRVPPTIRIITSYCRRKTGPTKRTPAIISTTMSMLQKSLLTTQSHYPVLYLETFMYLHSNLSKVQLCVPATLHVKSQSSSCNEIWILRLFSNVAEKTRSCFSLDTEQWYWTVTVQSLCRVKKISMTKSQVVSRALK